MTSSEEAESQLAKLYGKYRIRLVRTSDVPILWNLSGALGASLLLIDLPDESVESVEEKLSELHLCAGETVDDKENIPDGCVLAGDPLKVSFLTREKLEKDVNNRLVDNLGMISPQRFTLNTKPIPSREAQALVNRLFEERELGDVRLATTPYFVVSDGSAGHLLLLGRDKNAERVTSYRATYLGHLTRVNKRINALTARFHALPLLSLQYRCSFNMLEEVLMCEASHELVPASFMVHAEWKAVVGRNESNRHQCRTLSVPLTMPPDRAIATIKLKPGWLDERMAMADRVGELKQLKFLADRLRENKLPWGEYNQHNAAECDNSHLVEALSKLVASAKAAKDSQCLEAGNEFTGSFWEIAKCCVSAEQLATTFQVLYDEIRSGRFRVLVDAEDTSSLAKMLRVRNPSQIVFPRLEPFTCLQMLVELGVDHMSRDVLRRFRKEEFVANNADLGALQIDTSVSLEERIAQLIPAYLALQSMLMLDRVVRFAPHEKGVMTKKTIKHFTSAPPAPPHSKELVIRVSVEGLRAEKLTNMCEWTLEKGYRGKAGPFDESCTPDGGRIRELLHITKETALIKDVVPSMRTSMSAETQDKVADETVKSSSSFCLDGDGNASYECVHLTSFTTPIMRSLSISGETP